MKLLNLDKTTLMEVTSIDRRKSDVIIKGTILGSMPITCLLTPQEARSALQLLGWRNILFLATLLFRK